MPGGPVIWKPPWRAFAFAPCDDSPAVYAPKFRDLLRGVVTIKKVIARMPSKPKAKKNFTKTKEVKALAREQVGQIKSVRVIEESPKRKKPKYPEPFE